MKFTAENILTIIDKYENKDSNKIAKEIFKIAGEYPKESNIDKLKFLLIKELATAQIRKAFATKTFGKPKADLIKIIEKFLITNRENATHELFGYTYLHNNVFELTDMHIAFRIPQEKLVGIKDTYILTESEQKEKKKKDCNFFQTSKGYTQRIHH